VDQNNLDSGNYAQADSRLAGPESQGLGASNSGGDMEQWKAIPNCNAEISDKGHIRSSPRTIKGRERKGIIRKTRLNQDGYHILNLWINGKEQSKRIHQLVLQAFVGPPGEGEEVHHINGDKNDNRLVNLEYVTHVENLRHYWETDEAKVNCLRGSAHGMSRLTEQDVENMRNEYSHDDISLVQLSKKYGVAPNTVGDAVKGKTWEHVALNISAQFPHPGKFDGSIYRPSAQEMMKSLPDYTASVENKQLILQQEIAKGHTTVIYTGIVLGEIGGGVGQDSIRVVRRDESKGRTFYFKDGQEWVTRQVPQECNTPKKAMMHLVAKIDKEITKWTRPCPVCGELQVKCRAGKGREPRLWWKGTNRCRCPIEDGW